MWITLKQSFQINTEVKFSTISYLLQKVWLLLSSFFPSLPQVQTIVNCKAWQFLAHPTEKVTSSSNIPLMYQNAIRGRRTVYIFVWDHNPTKGLRGKHCTLQTFHRVSKISDRWSPLSKAQNETNHNTAGVFYLCNICEGMRLYGTFVWPQAVARTPLLARVASGINKNSVGAKPVVLGLVEIITYACFKSFMTDECLLKRTVH